MLPGLFSDAARRAREAGFDGVELHYAHAYTMASFLSRTNDARDGYGGSREGRARLPLEVFAAVRAAVGRPTSRSAAASLGDEVIEGGSRVEDAVDYGVAFARAGMDFLSISKGGKFDDARQPKVGEAVYPYTGDQRPRVHAHRAHRRPGRAGRARPFGRNLHRSRRGARRACAPPASRRRSSASGGIGTFELAERALREG